jgi:hypothetical protein
MYQCNTCYFADLCYSFLYDVVPGTKYNLTGIRSEYGREGQPNVTTYNVHEVCGQLTVK